MRSSATRKGADCTGKLRACATARESLRSGLREISSLPDRVRRRWKLRSRSPVLKRARRPPGRKAATQRSHRRRRFPKRGRRRDAGLLPIVRKFPRGSGFLCLARPLELARERSELQQVALNEKASVVGLLRKALLVANKADLQADIASIKAQLASQKPKQPFCVNALPPSAHPRECRQRDPRPRPRVAGNAAPLSASSPRALIAPPPPECRRGR